MDDITLTNAIELCEKYPNAKPTGVKKKEEEKKEAMKLFGLEKED